MKKKDIDILSKAMVNINTLLQNNCTLDDIKTIVNNLPISVLYPYSIYEVLEDGVPCYVGITKNSLNLRLSEHCWNKSSALYEHIQSVGREHFSINCLDKADTLSNGYDKERYWTKKYLEKYKLFNILIANGEGKDNLLYGVHREGAFKGHKHSKASKEKISEARKKFLESGGVPWNRGKKMNPNQIRKDYHHSEETKQKIRNKRINNGKRVICIETNQEFNSATEASNGNIVKANGIAKVCRGLQKTAYGYHWKYKEET